MHPGQLDVAPETVRRLVARQFPQWRELPLRAVQHAGDGQRPLPARRRPRRAAAARPRRRASRLEAEAAAAAELHGRTRFATPEPVAIGEPGPGYPLPWSVQTWLPGTVATPDGHSEAFAHDLAEFIEGVRAIDTRGRTFSGDNRGGHLPDHDAWMETCLERSEGLLDVPPLRRLWAAFRELPREGGDVMTHGDLIPGNLLVDGGRLAGVIDVGGLGPADPALDLVAAWHLLDPGPREAFRADLRCGDLEWARGAAWAFEQAMGLVWYYVETNPPMSHMGRRTLERLIAAGVA